MNEEATGEMVEIVRLQDALDCMEEQVKMFECVVGIPHTRAEKEDSVEADSFLVSVLSQRIDRLGELNCALGLCLNEVRRLHSLL